MSQKDCSEATLLQLIKVIYIPVVAQAYPHGLDSPVAVHLVVDVSVVFFNIPVVALRPSPKVQTALRTVFPQMHVDKVVDAPILQVVQVSSSFTCRGAEAFSYGPDGSSDHRDSQLLLNTVIDVPIVQVVQDIPVVVQRLITMVSLTMEIPQLLFDMVVYVPGVHFERVPQVPSW